MTTQVLPINRISDAVKAEIKTEIKDVVDRMFKACEMADFDKAMEPWLKFNDLVFIFNGTFMNYQGIEDAIKPLFDSLLNQEVKIIDEKYLFIDKTIVIYTSNCTFLENYKDGRAILSDPMVMQFTFIKTGDHWKVINAVESSIRQDIKKN